MQISEQMINIFNDLAQRFGVVIDWTQQNVLPYLQDLMGKIIKWSIFLSSFELGFGVLCIIGCVVCAVCAYRYHNHYCTDCSYEGMGTALFIIGSLICGVIGICFVIIGGIDLARVCIFPELQILEFVQGLM